MSAPALTRTRLGALTAMAAVIVILTGLSMHRLEAYVGAHLTKPRPIHVPLVELSRDFGQWRGQDEEPDDTIRDLTGMDDLRQLRLRRPGSNAVSLLITYSGRPRQLTGHYPEVCYPAAGWYLEYSKDVLLRGEDGRRIPAQLHFMSKFTENVYAQVYVVNTLVNNGVVTTDKTAADYRTIGQDRYVAQVQALFVGGESEAKVLADAESLFDPLLQQLGQHFQGSELTMVGD